MIMKKLFIVLTGYFIFIMNVAFMNVALATECVQPHTSNNVGHQFYEALVETPRDAIVKGAVATKELGQNVGAALVASNAAHNLKDAGKELVVDTPVKTAQAIKNGSINAYDKTKEGAAIAYDKTKVGAAIAYDTVIRKPAHKIKNTAKEVANSDFVQGTKETFVDIGEQFAEFGHDVADATKSGAHKVYHIMIEKPVDAIKRAARYFTHKKDEHKINVAASPICVMILPAPLLTARSLEAVTHNQNPRDVATPHATTISVMPLSWVDGSVQVYADDSVKSDDEIGVEFMMDVPCQIEEYSLSASTLDKLADTYKSIQNDLSQQE